MIHLKPLMIGLVGGSALVLTLQQSVLQHFQDSVMADAILRQGGFMPPHGWAKVWADVWEVLKPVLTLLLGGLATYYLQRLSKGQERATVAAVGAAQSADVAASAAQASAEAIVTDSARRDQKLDDIHEQGRITQAEGHKTHVLVNSQKTYMEKQNAALRALLTAAGVEIPPDLIAEPPSDVPPPDIPHDKPTT
jgi:hypothetical protein